MCAEMLQEMNLPRKQPPSKRDRKIYSLVMDIGASQEFAAEQFGISQARVSQIIQRVADWMHTVIGQRDGELPPDALDDDEPLTEGERLKLAEHIAYERMEFVYAEAMRAWRKSLEDASENRERSAKGEKVTERITRTQCGKVAYLNQAMRAAQASARLMGVDTTGREQRKRAEQKSANPNATAPQSVSASPRTMPAVAAQPVAVQTTNNPSDLRENRVSAGEAETFASMEAELAERLAELLEPAA